MKWSSPHRDTFVEGVRRFAPRAAVVDNTLDTIAGYLAGCRAFVSHFPNFYPEFCWRLWELLEAQQYHAAQQIARETAGEGVFVRPAMAAVGLDGGYSRLPSRDAVVTPRIRDGFKQLLEEIGDAQHRR